MINVIQFGNSFQGLSKYLFEGRRHANDDQQVDDHHKERVAFTHCHNLGTQNAKLAWRIMSDTARRAGELKQANGHGRGGRKSKGQVLHYVLSWKPEEAETLSHDEMKRAALESLKVLGKKRSKRRSVKTQTADEHQVLIVAHSDKGHAHVHVMVNRCHPESGLMLPTYKDRDRLSDWAHEYRLAQGLEHLTPERVKNYELRKKSRRRPKPGVRVKGTPRVPRHIYELQQAAQNDNTLRPTKVDAIKRQDRRLTKLTRAIHEKDTDQRKAMDAAYFERVKQIRAQEAADYAAENRRVFAEFDKRWQKLFEEEDAQRWLYEKQEQTWIGRQKNALKALASIDFRELIGRGSRGKALSSVFEVYTRPGARRASLEKALAAKAAELSRENKAAEDVAHENYKLTLAATLQINRAKYFVERRDLLASQNKRLARLKRLWAEQRTRRQSTLLDSRHQHLALRREQKVDQNQPLPEVFKAAAAKPSVANQTDAGDERQRQIEAEIEQMKQKREQRKRTRRERKPRKPRR